MAKIYGLFGTMTGKLADVVMVVRNGEQVGRKYQPVISNPSTPGQIAQRAKMKLMSQLSAVMAPVIAIRRNGAVSSRNMFTKANFPLTTYVNDQADINLNNIQLTSSVVALPQLLVSREGQTISVSLGASGGTILDVSRIVYAVFVKQSDNKIRLYDTKVVSVAGDANQYPTTFPNTSSSVVVYAYGVRDNTEAARVAFGNLTAPTAQQVASILVTRNLLESDVTLTETQGYTLESA